MAIQCPKPKRKRDATWFREKVLLVEAQGNGKVLEMVKFLMSKNWNSSAESWQEMPYSEPSHFVEHLKNEIHSDCNIIPYSQYLIESQNAAVQDTNSSAQQDALILSVFEQLSNQEKVFCHTSALKNDHRKLKGKDIVDNATQISNAATIAPGMYKLDLVILAPKVKNNREAHKYYLKHTMEQAAILRDYAEIGKSYYQIIRADGSSKIIRVDGSSKMYFVFSHTLKIFDREDLETLLLDDLRVTAAKVCIIAAKLNTNSINGAVNTAHGATTASTQATAVNSTTIDNLSDVVICAVLLKNTRRKLTVYGTETIGNFMPPKPDLSFSGLEEFTSEPIVIKPIVENSEAKASKAKPKEVRKNNGAPIIEDWVSDNKEDDVDCKKNIVPRAVLMKPGLVSANNARQVNAAHTKTTVNAARPMSYLSKIAHSTVKRPIHKNTTFKNSNFNQRVNIVKDKNVNTIRLKAVVNAAKPKAVVNAARPKAVVNAVKGNNVNVVKASACWVWKPKTKVIDHVSKHNSASMKFKRFDYINAQGRSRHKLMLLGINLLLLLEVNTARHNLLLLLKVNTARHKLTTAGDG
ncbi:hypothetical protein Tco_0141009 [Tanacetum coccineum]